MKLVKSSDIQQNNHMFFLYGSVGTGKTSSVKDMSGKTMVIAFDSSTDVLSGEDNIDIVELEEKDLKNMEKLLPQLIDRAVSDGYNNLVLDNVSNLEDYMLDTFKEQTKDTRMAYLMNKTWFRQIAQYLKTQPLNVLVTAWELKTVITKGMQEETYYKPMLNDKLANSFVGLFDLCGRTVYSEEDRFFIDVDNEHAFAKNRLSQKKKLTVDELFN